MSVTALSLSPNCPLLVVIVNYRSADLTINALRLLENEHASVPGFQVVVVENDSGDGSFEQIQAAITTEGWGDWATALAADRNGGYAYGNNLAIRPALQSPQCPPYFLLLNPDTVVRSGALKALVDFMDQHPDVGIAGSSFETGEGQPWPYAFRFPSILSELEGGIRLGLVTKLLSAWAVPRQMGDQPCPVDWIPGASMLVRRQVFEAVGLMDEAYFLYYEETDFCLQAQRAGWSCWYVPASRVMHIAGQSTGVTAPNVKPKRRPQYWFDSRHRYFVKNHGVIYAAVADAVLVVSFSLWHLRLAIQRRPSPDPPNFYMDVIRNTVFFRGKKLSEAPPSA